MIKKLRTAVVGVGYLGKFHAEKYALLDDCELFAVVDTDAAVAEQVAGKHNCLNFTDYLKVIDDIDAASIVVPTGLHYQVARAFLQAGKHVLVEKPIAVSVEEAEDLTGIARRTNSILQVGHLERFNAAVMALDLNERPLFIESHRLARFNPRARDVCVVLDLMIHDIDIILNFVNSEVERIEASGIPVLTDDTDIANARIVFKNGCVANVTASRVSMKNERKMRLFRANSYVSIDFQSRVLTQHKRGSKEMFPGILEIETEKKAFENGDAILEEIKHFVQCIRTGEEPIVSGEAGTRALKTAINITNLLQSHPRTGFFPMISMVDLKQQYAQLKNEIDQGIHEVLDGCHFILGPNVVAFEKEAANFLGVKHAIGVASGTDALHLALDAAGIGEGDEVITTPFTFIASAEAIRYVGAKPVFVDIDPRTFNVDIDAVEQAITEKTAAVMPVHLFGQPVDIHRLKSICERNGLKLIEDCAQSFGAAVVRGQTGSFGDAGGFSFFPSKNLGCFGDGGLVTTQSDVLAENVKSLRNHGSKMRYHHDRIGINSRLDELQAVILRAKLTHINEFNAARRQVAHLYSELLSDLPVTVPYEDGYGVHVYHQYTLLSERRDDIAAALQRAGIASAIYYPIPLHRQDVFRDDYKGLSLPVAETVANRCLSLPIYPELSSDEVRHIVSVIKSVV